jgi:hypothetical protein
MDENQLKPDSNLLVHNLASDSLANLPGQRDARTKDYIAGVSIILVLSITLFLLFNLRTK